MELEKVRLINWAWSKFLYIDLINQIIWDKKYNNIADWFLGSWNLLLNISKNADKYIGIDNIKLIPNLFQWVNSWNIVEIKEEDYWNIVNQYNNFKEKEYYVFRDHWNEKFANNDYDIDFFLRTIMLLKMCSNSMVRFNSKWVFNQGFRLIAKSASDKWEWFFTDRKISTIVKETNKLLKILKENNFEFRVDSFLNQYKKFWKGDLLLLDPPYILAEWKGWIYQAGEKAWNETKEKEILEFLLNDYEWDFLYFNFTKVIIDWVEHKHNLLLDFIDKYNEKKWKLKLYHLREKVGTWQWRKESNRSVEELIITNI